MNIYICLETIIQNPKIIPKIKELYKENKITIGCTANFYKKNSIKDIERMLEPLKNCYNIINFLKPEYDMIIDQKSETIQSVLN